MEIRRFSITFNLIERSIFKYWFHLPTNSVVDKIRIHFRAREHFSWVEKFNGSKVKENAQNSTQDYVMEIPLFAIQ